VTDGISNRRLAILGECQNARQRETANSHCHAAEYKFLGLTQGLPPGRELQLIGSPCVQGSGDLKKTLISILVVLRVTVNYL
jgi:hypothetical protein